MCCFLVKGDVCDCFAVPCAVQNIAGAQANGLMQMGSIYLSSASGTDIEAAAQGNSGNGYSASCASASVANGHSIAMGLYPSKVSASHHDKVYASCNTSVVPLACLLQGSARGQCRRNCAVQLNATRGHSNDSGVPQAWM